MAANYSVKELLNVLRSSNDPEVLRDAMSRFGLVSKALIEADAISTRATDIMVAMIPDYVNARKANKTIVESLGDIDAENDADVDDGVEDDIPAKKMEPKPKKAAKEQEQEVESGENDYHSMKAKDLFDLCKKRGIEAEARHRTKYYIDLLEKADAESAEPVEKPAVEADDDDDWDI